jgi:hypothetical protein
MVNIKELAQEFGRQLKIEVEIIGDKIAYQGKRKISQSHIEEVIAVFCRGRGIKYDSIAKSFWDKDLCLIGFLNLTLRDENKRFFLSITR